MASRQNVSSNIDVSTAGSSTSNISNSIVGVSITGEGSVNVGRDLVVNSGSEESFEELDLPAVSNVFEGREKDLDKLDTLFFKKGIKKVVISGLPGFGKTELAKQFAKHCIDSKAIDKAFWVNAEIDENLKRIWGILKKAYQKFKNKRCLFIFDNGISRKSITGYKPPETDNFFLLITSQMADWGDDFKQMKVEELDMDASMALFKEILTYRFQTEDINRYKELAMIVDNAPLGLIIIAGNLKQKIDAVTVYNKIKFDFQHYINRIRATVDKMNINHTLETLYEKSMYAAMSLALEKLLNQNFADEKTRKQTTKLLVICAHLNPVYIDIETIEDIMEGDNEENTMADCIFLSKNFSFLEYDWGYIKIHRLCQRILKLYFNEIKGSCYRACVLWVLRKNGFNPHNATILMEADENKQIISEIFLSSDDNCYKEILLRLLVDNGCCECCKLIFETSTPEQNKQYVDDWKLLHIEWESDQTDIFKLFSNYGDLNIQNGEGKTPLHRACWRGNADIVKILLEKELNLHAQDNNGCTPLHCACLGGNADVVKMLLDRELDPKAQDKNGETPLHLACWTRTADIVKMLLDGGANAHAQDRQGITPLGIATRCKQSDIINIIQQYIH